MFRFLVYHQGEPATHWPLRNTYLLGADGNPMRCSIWFEDGEILVEKRESGSGALGLLHPAGEVGEITLQTCLLPEREAPYLLRVELARHRVMLMYTKLEEWGMFEIETDHAVAHRKDKARDQFIESLCLQGEKPAEADGLAQSALEAALDGTEELALAHSSLILQHRRHTGQHEPAPIGCGVPIDQAYPRLQAAVRANFDWVHLPTPWQALSPEEGAYHWQPLDQWMQWAGRQRLPVLAGPLLSFEPGQVPDWLYIWEHDYDTVRDLVYEHIERVVSRYANVVRTWTVVSGLHVNRYFPLTFEQIIDLTRMAAMLVKKQTPRARVAIEIAEPFGEYFSSNQRSIPPVMYTDLLLQSGIEFDVLGLSLVMGQARPGQYTRDLMQMSSLLDHFSTIGKPLLVTAAAPSQPVTSAMIAAPQNASEPVDAHCGHWRRAWSATVQSPWLEAMLQIALSKPYTEAFIWKHLVDHPQMDLPLSGLLTENWQPKSAYQRLMQFRRGLSHPAADQPQAVAPAGPDAEAAAGEETGQPRSHAEGSTSSSHD